MKQEFQLWRIPLKRCLPSLGAMATLSTENTQILQPGSGPVRARHYLPATTGTVPVAYSMT